MYYPYWYIAPNGTYYKYPYRTGMMNDPNKKPMMPRPCEKNPYDFFDLGDKAPNFTLPAIVNGQPTDVTLSDYQGKWVLLFFYGSDFTFV